MPADDAQAADRGAMTLDTSSLSDRSPRPQPAGIVLVTELFPPAVGGSAELFANVYGRIGGRRVVVLTHGDRAGTDAASGSMTVQRRPMRTPHWGLIHPAGLAGHLRLAVRLRRLTRAGPVVVHAGRVLPEGLRAWLARRAGGPPYVCWAHGEEINYARASRELTLLMPRVYRGAAAILANSRNTARLLEAFGAPPDRIHVVHPGVDSSRFRPDAPGAGAVRARLAGDGDVVLLTVGRLQRRKGHDLVLRALAELDAAAVRYVVVGDGDERARLERLTDELGLRGRVRFEGIVPGDALPAYYAAADVFVHPNRLDHHDFEGFGLVFVEAAASGLPVVGGATGGVPEAINEGVNGLLVGGEDASELAAALSGLIRSPDRRRAMGRAGREWAARFTWERAAAEVAAVHDRVAAG